MAHVFLGEKITYFDLIQTAVALLAAYLVFSGAAKSNSTSMDVDTDSLAYKISFIGLFTFPVLTSLGMILMRKMRTLETIVLVFYLNLCNLALSSLFIVIGG